MHRTYIQTSFFFTLLIGVLILGFFIFLPYLITLSMATTFAVVTFPLYKRITAVTYGRENIAALLTILITVLLVLAPLSFIGTQVVWESQNLYQRIAENQVSLTENFASLFDRFIKPFAPQLNLDFSRYAGQGLSWFAAKIGPLFTGTAQTILYLFLGMIAFYYFLKDGRKFLASIVALSPLPDAEDAKILSRLEIAINSIIRGTLVIALIQGVLTGIGLTIFGVPSATLWGSMAAVGALVPGVGTAVVFLPAVLFLFFTGNTFAAIGLLVWGVLAVGLIDNFLGPVLVGRGVRIHPLLILFGVIGGLGFFGPVGFLLGPLVLSLLYALLDVYRELFVKKNTSAVLKV